MAPVMDVSSLQAAIRMVSDAASAVKDADLTVLDAVAANGKDAVLSNHTVSPEGKGEFQWVNQVSHAAKEFTIHGLPTDKQLVGVSRDMTQVYVKDSQGFWEKMNMKAHYDNESDKYNIGDSANKIQYYQAVGDATRTDGLVIAYTTVTETDQSEAGTADSGYIRVGGYGLSDRDTDTRNNFFVPSEMQLLLPDGSSISGEELKNSLVNNAIPVDHKRIEGDWITNNKVGLDIGHGWTYGNGWWFRWFSWQGRNAELRKGGGCRHVYDTREYFAQGAVENHPNIQVEAHIKASKDTVHDTDKWVEVVDTITIDEKGFLCKGGRWTVQVDNSTSKGKPVRYEVEGREFLDAPAFTHGIGSMK